MQLNKEIQRTDLPKKELFITDLSITHSIPIHSLNPLPCDGDVAANRQNGKETSTQSAVEIYLEIIKDNIEYEHLAADKTIDSYYTALVAHDMASGNI